MPILRRLSQLAGLLVVGVSCQEAGPSASLARDSELVLVADTLYSIDDRTLGPNEYLGRIAGIGFDRRENLHVLDPDQYRVVTWNNGGRRVRRFGNRGDGPGEFRVPRFAYVLRNGYVVVGDIGHSALLEFGAGGRYRRSVRLSPEKDAPVPGAQSVLAGDRLIGRDDYWLSRPAPTEERRPLFSYAFAEEGVVASPYYDAWGPPLEQRNWAMMPQVRIAGFSDGRVALVDSVGYRVKILSDEGEIERVIERPILPLPVTDTTRMAEHERATNRLTEQDVSRGLREMAAVTGISLSSVDSRQVVADYQEGLGDTQFADEIPVIQKIAVDWGSRMWITRSDAVGADGPIDLIEADGRYVGTLQGSPTPDAFGPNGLLAYITEHELGTQSVVVVRIRSIAPAME